MSRDTLPKIDDFQAFYVYGDEIKFDLMGRALSEQQNVVWEHDKDIRPLGKITHHSDVSQHMMKVIK